MLLSILTGVAVAISGVAPGGTGVVGSPQGVIRIVESSYEIDFPIKITFSMEARSDVDITEITFFYRLGRDTATTYAYPKFVPLPDVSATFSLPTSGSSYIPSGADIEYYYVIVDEAGNRVESKHLTLEYKDPSFQWDRSVVGDLVVLTHDRGSDEVARIATEVNDRMADIKELLGLDTVNPLKAVIFSGSREASRSFPRVSQTATDNHVFGGFAYGEYDVFILGGLNRNGMIHESTHLLIDEALTSPLAEIPTWLNEGLAMYYEIGGHRRQQTVERAARGDQLFPIQAMGRVPGRPQEVGIYYAQSWSFVDFLMTKHGPERMSELFELVKLGSSVEDALPQVYGSTLQQLDFEWRSNLLQQTRLADLPDPGSIGTSVIIAGAAALTAVIMIIRWIRGSAGKEQAEEIES